MKSLGVEGAAERIRRTLQSWREVSLSDHPIGGTVFRAHGREFGQLLGTDFVGIKFAADVIEEVQAYREVDSVHVAVGEAGRVTVHLRHATDVEHAISLLERSYWDVCMIDELKKQLS